MTLAVTNIPKSTDQHLLRLMVGIVAKMMEKKSPVCQHAWRLLAIY